MPITMRRLIICLFLFCNGSMMLGCSDDYFLQRADYSFLSIDAQGKIISRWFSRKEKEPFPAYLARRDFNQGQWSNIKDVTAVSGLDIPGFPHSISIEHGINGGTILWTEHWDYAVSYNKLICINNIGDITGSQNIANTPDDSTWVMAMSVMANGDCTVVWSHRYIDYHIRYNIGELHDGKWQSQEIDLTIDSTIQKIYYAATSVNNNGKGFIVWNLENGDVYMSERVDGQWVHPSTSSEKRYTNTQAFDIEINDNDFALFVASQPDSNNPPRNHILVTENRGGTWNLVTDITDIFAPETYLTALDISMNNQDDAVVSWINNTHLYLSEFRNGDWSHPADENDTIVHNNFETIDSKKISINENGETLLVWSQWNYISKLFLAQYRNGSWVVPESDADPLNFNFRFYEGYEPLMYDIAVNDSGIAVVQWSQRVGNNNYVYSSIFQDEKWNHPQSVDDQISYVK